MQVMEFYNLIWGSVDLVGVAQHHFFSFPGSQIGATIASLLFLAPGYAFINPRAYSRD